MKRDHSHQNKNMRKIAASIAVGLLFCASAHAEMVSVPCAEFVEVTGNPIACDKMPVIKMSKAKWDAEKASAQGKKSGEADLPPWKRGSQGKTAVADAPVSNGCDLPPWKRPENLKCN